MTIDGKNDLERLSCNYLSADERKLLDTLW